MPAGKVIQREKTSFHVEIDVQLGLQLQHGLSAADLAVVTDPCSDQASQAVGIQMRQLDVEAFEVPSARAPLEPPCVGVLTPAAFASTPFDTRSRHLGLASRQLTPPRSALPLAPAIPVPAPEAAQDAWAERPPAPPLARSS